MHYLAAPETRVLLIHGQTGCGKSSFLRAGLIPALEELPLNFFFLRDGEGAPLFIRSGPDPIGRIAEQVFHFASKPVTVGDGEPLDLSAARLGDSDLHQFVEECRKPGVLRKSLRALSTGHPYTLTVILDQAEEVVTLGNRNHEHQRQFFRFIKEFVVASFPIKFVIALRKDYSGEFIGHALLGGSLEFSTADSGASVSSAGPEPRQNDPTHPIAKPDMKIFLLSDLNKSEVSQAILLPTSKLPTSVIGAPFDTYGFSYAEGVADDIVRDLFDATSATAVLPVMQIVCRDLYHKVRDKPAPKEIDYTLYADGGRISGPVDRHVSDSLRDAFGNRAGADVESEERKWREILFRFVSREADGTVHTKIVDESELRKWAKELKTTMDVERVVAHLSQSDVLLLRGVTILSSTAADDGGMYSLGHDVIGMVLQAWKSKMLEVEANEKAAEEARKKIADEHAASLKKIEDERKASRKRIRNYAWVAAGVVGVVGVLAGGALLYIQSSEMGKLKQRHEVLFNMGTHTARSTLLDAMYAAAQATRDAKEIGYIVKDDRADKLLANLLAGLPSVIAFANPPASAQRVMPLVSVPLPKSIGFATYDATQIGIKRGIDGMDEASHDLEKIATDENVAIQSTVAESDDGAVLLLRTSAPTQFAPGIDQVFVIRGKEKWGPFYVKDFLEKLTDSAGDSVEVGGHQLSVRNGVVLLATDLEQEKQLRLVSFVFDAAGAKEHPFKLLKQKIEFDSAAQGGPLPPYLFLDDYVVLPRTVGTKSAAGTIPQRYVRYALRSETAKEEALTRMDELMKCDGKQSCDWELIYPESVDNFLLLGALKSGRSGERPIGLASQPDMDRFERFIVFDVATNQGINIETEDLAVRREACAKSSGQIVSPGTARKRSASRLFVSGAKDAILVGVLADHSLDLMRFDKTGGTPTCVGTLFFSNDVDRWKATVDGKMVLAGGTNVEGGILGAVWQVTKPTSDAASEFRKGDMVKVACERGLSSYEKASKDSIVAKYLGEVPGTLCAASPPSSDGKSR